MLVESYVQSDVVLGVSGLLGVWEARQEVGRLNRPICLRNLLLPKLVHLALGLLGMSYTVPVDLEYLDARYGWILESRIDIEGCAEFSPLLVELLLARILCSSQSRGFLRSVEITQESRYGDGRKDFHKICGWV